MHKEQESSAFKTQRESGRVEAGQRRLREVHLGVPLLNKSRRSVCRVKAQEHKLGWYRGI